MANHNIVIYVVGLVSIIANVFSHILYKKLHQRPLKTFMPWYMDQLKAFQKDMEEIFGKELAGSNERSSTDKPQLISNIFSHYTSNATLFLRQINGQYIKKTFFGINSKILDEIYFTGDSALISFFRKTGGVITRSNKEIISRKSINPQEKELIINEMKAIDAETCFPIGGRKNELYGFLSFGRISYNWSEHDEIFFTLTMPLIISSMFSVFDKKRLIKSLQKTKQLYSIKDRRRQENIPEVARAFLELIIHDGYSAEKAIKRISTVDSFKYNPEAVETLLEAHEMGLI